MKLKAERREEVQKKMREKRSSLGGQVQRTRVARSYRGMPKALRSKPRVTRIAHKK